MFDTINQSRLLSRPQITFGIQGTVFVSINSKKSTTRELTVVWYSTRICEEPVLYLLYTEQLAEVIESHGLDYHMYVDDNQLYFSFKTQEVDLGESKLRNVSHLFVTG